ncbi:MAG: hypothetical protein KAS93_01605 [Gammaproteobacteria bacterium]|nr:hypothetical protein [Gammaproteobacteria bacterium]
MDSGRMEKSLSYEISGYAQRRSAYLLMELILQSKRAVLAGEVVESDELFSRLTEKLKSLL